MQTEDRLIPYHSSDFTGRKVLVLAPHPDDETIGCGGSMALHADAGDPVKVVLLTNGAKGDTLKVYDKEDYVALRQSEAVRACASLGVGDMEFWGEEDRALAGSRTALLRLKKLFEEYQPELVYAPSILEFHPDHRAACLLLYQVIRCEPRGFEVAFYEVGQPLRVNALIDITQVLPQKGRALEAYESQCRERPYGEMSLALNRYRSMTLSGESTHAEGFFLCDASWIRKAGVFSIHCQNMERLSAPAPESGPLVSVILRTQNRPSLLALAVQSVVRQTYANVEMVVVNDGGEDVEELVRGLASGTGVTYIRHEHPRGRGHAANAGLTAARGLYLNFLDDDDILYPNHIETLVQALEMSNEKIVYGSVLSAFFTGPPEKEGSCARKILNHDVDFDPDRLLFQNYIPIMSVLFHRDVLQRIGMFQTDMELFEDWDFWIRASRTYSFRHVPEVTAEYRFYGSTSTEESHYRKYDYSAAQARIFESILPHLDGQKWVNLLNSGLLAHLGQVAGRVRAMDGQQQACHSETEDLVARLTQGVKEILDQETRLLQKEKEALRLQEEASNCKSQMGNLEARLLEKESQLEEIFSSKGWAWLSLYRRWKSRFQKIRA